MSDDLKQLAEENRIIEIVGGSHLYGTSTPESDEDFVGVFLPPREYILGLQSVKEVDLGIKDKGDDGKNTVDAVDRKLYEFRKFLNLALGNNPNIIEILFANEDAIIEINDYGRALLEMKEHFPSKLCMQKFIGYAHSQRHKMIIRRDHFNDLRAGMDILEGIDDSHMTMETVQANNPEVFNSNGHHVKVGDLNIERGSYVKKAKKIIGERLSKATNRTELVLKHGYDTKFASHLIRLLYQGLMLLECGEIIFPLPMAELLLEIKAGNWTVEEVLEHADKLEAKMDEVAEKTSLPKTPNFKAVEKFCIETMQTWLG